MRRKRYLNRKRLKDFEAVTLTGIIFLASAGPGQFRLSWDMSSFASQQMSSAMSVGSEIQIQHTADGENSISTIPGAITISTPQEFLDFADQCQFDTYSKGKIFALTKDLDFSGLDCSPVPSFGGTFLGNGFTIRGWKYDKPGSDIGLFRFVEQGAVIENLNIEAQIRPQGSRERIGVLAGSNRGQIKNCQVAGSVKGKTGTGGLVGKNEPTGLIENCLNQAVVTGLENTGGIAGENEGIIESCVNEGAVNTTNVTEDEETPAASQIHLGGRILEAEKVYHTGGIAGHSKGIIRACTNVGTIGYPHAGYNTGGIAGMQNGCIYQCVNEGDIRGRKDTGGIVGQFEPYIHISYEEDTMQQVQNQIDTLIDQMDSLGNMLGNTGDAAVADVDGLRSTLKGIRSSIQRDKSYYFNSTKSFTEDLDASLDSLKDSVDQVNLQVETGSVGTDVRKIRNQSENLQRLRQEFPSAILKDPNRAKQILAEMEQSVSMISDTVRRLPRSVQEDLDDTQDNINEQLNQVGDRADDTMDVIRDNKDRLFQDLENTNDSYQPQFDALSNNLDRIYETMSNANAQTQSHMDGIRSQLRLIQDTIEHGADRIQNLRDEDVVEDVSDQDRESAGDMGSGQVVGCANNGAVSSDNNVGGIAGIIGLEVGLDPEQDIDVSGDHSLRSDRTSRAVTRSNVNHGAVISQNHYAGGIVGRADAGALSWNENYADVRTVDGDYAGGIAGSSANVARNNYVLCRVIGNNYLGGVVGKGQDVKDNCVAVTLELEDDHGTKARENEKRSQENMGGDNQGMDKILISEGKDSERNSASGEYLGAVAGLAEGDQVSGNWFVWSGEAAFNGVTYASQAQVLTFEELLSRPDVPKAFQMLQVTFVSDGRLVDVIDIPYGEAVSPDQIPDVPQKDGCYGIWNQDGLDEVRWNITAEAIYHPWTTTLEAGTDNQGEKDSKRSEIRPSLLIEGEFHPQTQVVRRTEAVQAEEDESSFVPAGYDVRQICSFTIDSPMGRTWKELKVRALTDGIGIRRDVAIAVKTPNGIELVESVQDGSYQLFEMEEEGEFLILEKTASWYPAACIGAGICAVAAWYFTRYKKRGKISGRREKRNTNTEKDVS